MTTKTNKKESKETGKLMAVIKTGGKQYLVKEGGILKIEKIDESEINGGKITFEDVLLIDDGNTAKIGTPTIKGSSVIAEVIENSKEKKVVVIRYKAKSRYFKKRGHRQIKTLVKVTDIK